MSKNNNKIWQIYPVAPDTSDDNQNYISKLIRQLLYNRGITDEAAVKRFLKPPEMSGLPSPFLFSQMDRAVERTVWHIKNGNKIFVYGDYDADGVSAAALLLEVLQTLKAKAEIYIPYRMTEGYGLNRPALEEIAKSGARLVITRR